MCSWHNYCLPNRHQKSLAGKMLFCLVSLGRTDFFPFPLINQNATSVSLLYFCISPGGGGAVFPSTAPCSCSKYCILCVSCWGNRKGLVRLNPKCMEQGENEVFGIPLTALVLFLCTHLSTFLQGSHTCSVKIPGRFLIDVQRVIGCILALLSIICPTVLLAQEKNSNLI